MAQVESSGTTATLMSKVMYPDKMVALLGPVSTRQASCDVGEPAGEVLHGRPL